MMLMTHNTDIADAWEREGEDRDYFQHFSPDGYAVGINVLLDIMALRRRPASAGVRSRSRDGMSRRRRDAIEPLTWSSSAGILKHCGIPREPGMRLGHRDADSPILSRLPRLHSDSKLAALLLVCLLVAYSWPRDLDLGPNINAHLSQALAIAVDGTLAIDNYAHLRSPTPSTGRLPRTAISIRPRRPVAPWSRSGRVGVLVGRAADRRGSPERRIHLAKGDPRELAAERLAFGSVHGPAVSAHAQPRNVSRRRVRRNHSNCARHGLLPIRDSVLCARPRGQPHHCRGRHHLPADGPAVADALAGAVAGFAVVFDYPAAIAVVTCGLSLLLLRPGAVVYFIAGGLVPLAVLLTYHAATLGSPLATPYDFQNPVFRPQAGGPFGGPDLRVLIALLFSPFRGLLFYSPVVVSALPGAIALWRGANRDSDDMRGRIYVLLASATLFRLVAAQLVLLHVAWRLHYGPALHRPRRVLLGPLIASGWSRLPVLTSCLLAVSSVNQLAIATVWLQVPNTYTNPLVEVVYPRFLAGDYVRGNLGMRFGLTGLWSISPVVITLGLALLTAVRILRAKDTVR